MKQFDISTAYLYGELEELMYMQPPKGVKTDRTKCLKLIKSLYGLRQAPRAWHSKLSQVLMSIGLKPLQSEPYLFTDEQRKTFVYTYIDDGMVCAKTIE